MKELYSIYHPQLPQFLRELSACPSMERLKLLGMNCGCEYTQLPEYQDLPPYSRWQHSLGVGLIVWHFTGNRAQATAGLLHDIATPTFAHVVDFLHGDHMRQESTEQGTAEIISADAMLVQSLAKYGLHPAQVEDYHDYPIADNDAPRLSADRLEYTMGNAVNFGFAKAEEMRILYQDLRVGTNELGQPELVFQSPDCAKRFAELSLQCSYVYIADANRLAMELLAQLLREAIQDGSLQESDLHSTEEAVIAKLKRSGKFAARWEKFCSLCGVRISEQKIDGACYQIPSKKRWIDPLIQNCGRTSERFPSYRHSLQEYFEHSLRSWLSPVEKT